MTQDELKQAVARAAIEYVVEGEIVGVGTGSTANYFIDELGKIKHKIKGAVASSEATAQRLAAHGIQVFDLNDIASMPVYIDGADEITASGAMIKGGGAALTREKIIAQACAKFVCVIDPAKRVDVLGRFPLPVEVIPMARSLVARELVQLTGGQPVWRQGVITDNGNWVLDVHGLAIADPRAMETAINQVPGVVSVGLFAHRPADVVIVGGEPPLVF